MSILQKERLDVLCKKKEQKKVSASAISQKQLENIGISDIGKDPILCIHNLHISQNHNLP